MTTLIFEIQIREFQLVTPASMWRLQRHSTGCPTEERVFSLKRFGSPGLHRCSCLLSLVNAALDYPLTFHILALLRMDEIVIDIPVRLSIESIYNNISLHQLTILRRGTDTKPAEL